VDTCFFWAKCSMGGGGGRETNGRRQDRKING
jgi:hypothetical protein